MSAHGGSPVIFCQMSSVASAISGNSGVASISRIIAITSGLIRSRYEPPLNVRPCSSLYELSSCTTIMNSADCSAPKLSTPGRE